MIISQYLHNTFKRKEDKLTVITSVIDMRGEKYEEREMNKEIRRKKRRNRVPYCHLFFLVHSCILHSEASGATNGRIEIVYFDKGFFFPFFFLHYRFLKAVHHCRWKVCFWHGVYVSFLVTCRLTSYTKDNGT